MFGCGFVKSDPETYVVNPRLESVDSKLGKLLFSRYSAGSDGERKVLFIELFSDNVKSENIVFRLISDFDDEKALDCLLEVLVF